MYFASLDLALDLTLTLTGQKRSRDRLATLVALLGSHRTLQERRRLETNRRRNRREDNLEFAFRYSRGLVCYHLIETNIKSICSFQTTSALFTYTRRTMHSGRSGTLGRKRWRASPRESHDRTRRQARVGCFLACRLSAIHLMQPAPSLLCLPSSYVTNEPVFAEYRHQPPA